MTSQCFPEVFGAEPAIIKWQVIRGDTSPLRIEFYENDEVTFLDTSSWTYSSSTYDVSGDVVSPLEVYPGSGYVDIVASPEITALWGSGYSSVVGELAFDLQVTLETGEVWTPVLGTIVVLGDVTGGSL